jgi:hypothetical protein
VGAKARGKLLAALSIFQAAIRRNHNDASPGRYMRVWGQRREGITMQITLKDRETVTGAATFYTPPVDVSSMALFTYNFTVHAASGTSQTFALTFETSDNLEDWQPIGSAMNQDTAGTNLGSLDAKSGFYGRYIRASLVTGGTSPMFNYSIWLNTFASS